LITGVGIMDRTHEIVKRLAVNEEKVMELYSVFGDVYIEEYKKMFLK